MVKKLERLDEYKPRYLVGFLDAYVNRVLKPRGARDRYLVATATFPRLRDASIFIETPWINPVHFGNRDLRATIFAYLDDQLPAPILPLYISGSGTISSGQTSATLGRPGTCECTRSGLQSRKQRRSSARRR